jgi:predicted secreted hydrolase
MLKFSFMDHRPIRFPEDHQPHSSTIEWWYYNGRLKSGGEGSYGFMVCLFKADIEKAELPFLRRLPIRKMLGSARHAYFAHTIVSDIGARKTYKEVQNISLVSKDSFSRDRLFVEYIDPVIVRGYVNNEIAEISPDTFHVKTGYLDLVLSSKKPALLENGDGHITVCGRESRYYSLTDLEAVGQVSVGGKIQQVTGRAWMDHQWADTPYRRDKWTWFSLQLEDGTDMMCCEYGDGTTKDCLVDIISKTNTDLHFRSLVLKPGKRTWKSKDTMTEYPLSWDIEVPEYGARLHVETLLPNQELIFMAINYWEGPIDISGTIGGRAVKGTGFMELVGYP